jgi:hypothetical protein
MPEKFFWIAFLAIAMFSIVGVIFAGPLAAPAPLPVVATLGYIKGRKDARGTK